MDKVKTFEYCPPDEPLNVVHVDADLLVVNKPAGLLSVPGKAAEHSDCLEARVRRAYPSALLVHRLDMDTSGIMVFAMNKAAQRHLGLQFERRILHKTYVAVVDGVIAGDSGVVDLPLIVDWPNRPLQKVCHDTGKSALTEWSIKARGADWTRVSLCPKTGRSHQLRVHMLALGHPILGDRFYGDALVIGRSERLQLHSEKLELRHPTGGDWVAFNILPDF